jgi:hypothetical protein
MRSSGVPHSFGEHGQAEDERAVGDFFLLYVLLYVRYVYLLPSFVTTDRLQNARPKRVFFLRYVLSYMNT